MAFALGMFIPLQLNIPLVVGGAINWYVTSRSKDATLNTERGEKGTLLASGFIAGGALNIFLPLIKSKVYSASLIAPFSELS